MTTSALVAVSFSSCCFGGVGALLGASVISERRTRAKEQEATPPRSPPLPPLEVPLTPNDRRPPPLMLQKLDKLKEAGAGDESSGKVKEADEPQPQLSSMNLLPSPGGPRPFLRQCSGRVCNWGEYCQCNRVLLCMVGLPARGKSYIAKMLTRYLRWTGFPVQTFNAGNLRRKEGMAGASADFFVSTSGETADLRERIALECLENSIEWLEEQDSSCVAIFDATNTTKKRRQQILERAQKSPQVCTVFIENICTDPEILEANYKMKLDNDDYKGKDPVEAKADFLQRVKAYEARYETIEDSEFSGDIAYMQLINVGRKVVMHRCEGFITSNIGFYLSNIHISPRRIWLMTSAEVDEKHPRRLSQRGLQYSQAVARMLRGSVQEMEADGLSEGSKTIILTGTDMCHGATMRAVCNECSMHMAKPSVMTTSLLNDLDQGDLNGLSVDDIQTQHPEVWAEREYDALHFRYPGQGGESYLDVVGRLRPVIIELERQRHSVLIVASPAVKRCLYAYFTGCDLEEMPRLPLDRMSVHELRPSPHGTKVSELEFELGQHSDEQRSMSLCSTESTYASEVDLQALADLDAGK